MERTEKGVVFCETIKAFRWVHQMDVPMFLV